MKGNVVIIEATSTGANFIHDARQLGYNPICMELYQTGIDEKEHRMAYDWFYSINGEKLPEILQADESYEKTLEMVKKLNPVAIVPGADQGIDWANRMSQELGLNGNPPDIYKKMVDKQCMQKALKRANLRYIKTREVSSFEEAKEFVSEIGASQIVVKPSIGQSTIGVCICKNDEELKDAIDFNKQAMSWSDDSNMIVQEYIGGEEFAIDSTCCEGHNRIVCASHYIKTIIEGRGAIFNYAESINENHPNFAELAEYNEKVLSALGIQYGATHAEFKIDEKGIVLIEINCRVSGPIQKYSFMDKVWGEHPTESALESYLNPQKCIENSKKPFKPVAFGAVKMVVIPEEIEVIKSHVETVFEDLNSYDYALSFGDNRVYPKTIDLHTIGGLIFLANADKDQLTKDIKTIQRMEKFEIEKIFDIK